MVLKSENQFSFIFISSIQCQCYMVFFCFIVYGVWSNACNYTLLTCYSNLNKYSFWWLFLTAYLRFHNFNSSFHEFRLTLYLTSAGKEGRIFFSKPYPININGNSLHILNSQLNSTEDLNGYSCSSQVSSSSSSSCDVRKSPSIFGVFLFFVCNHCFYF